MVWLWHTNLWAATHQKPEAVVSCEQSSNQYIFVFYCCGSGSLSCFVQFGMVPVSVSPNLFVYMFFFPSSLSPINLAVQSGLPSALLSPEATLSWMLLCSEDLKSGTALTAAQTTSLCTSDVQD